MVVMLTVMIVLLVCLSGFFSGVETGIYRLSKFRLRLGVDQKRPLHKVLAGLTADSRELILSCLIGNNIVNYLLSATITLILISNDISEHRAELYNSFITTPAVLILGELIPKNLFFYRADVLMPAMSPLLWFFHRLFRYIGAIPLLKTIAAAVTRLTGSTATPELAPAAQRHQLYEIIKETREEGFLSSIQTAIMTRLANMHTIHLDTVMVPVARVRMVDVNTSRAGLLEEIKSSPYSRMPVFEKSRSNIVGFVEVYKALCSESDFADLRQFVKPITAFSSADSVIAAINRMRRENHKIVLVSRAGSEAGKALGIVTMKDLVEELTGELAEW